MYNYEWNNRQRRNKNRKNDLLTKKDIEKYNSQYNNLTIKYDNTFHDKYIILAKEKVYHLGSSIKHIESKTFSISVLPEKVTRNLFNYFFFYGIIFVGKRVMLCH